MEQREKVESIRCDTGREFLALLRRSNELWERKGADAQWIFRGQSNADWPLRPRLWRPTVWSEEAGAVDSLNRSWTDGLMKKLESNLHWQGEHGGPFGELFTDLDQEWVKKSLFPAGKFALPLHRVREVIRAWAAEERMVRRFMEIADELGYPVGGPMKAGNLDLGQVVRWDLPTGIEFAQHHGLPTRVLDWTRKPEIAAFFAAGDARSTSGEMAVYALHESAWSKSRPDAVSWQVQVLAPKRSNHSYLHAQESLFTWLKNGEIDYLLTESWPSLESKVGSGLVKLVLPRSEAPELKRLLWRERVSQAHLMPTYDNIAGVLKERWAVESAELDTSRG